MDDQKLAEAVNRSGFPLQVRLRHEVQATHGQHGWSVLYEEHAWRLPNGESGFMDLVLEDRHRTSVLVVESKRERDVARVFLVDDEKQLNRRHVNGWMNRRDGTRHDRAGPFEYTADPGTPQSAFCVVAGKDGPNRMSLESICSDVLSAVQGLAGEEKAMQLKDRDMLRMYFAAVVTTAPLYVCRYQAADVSLTDGMMSDPAFKSVPFVRFRKQLDARREVPETLAVQGPRELSRAKESTVFVIQSEAFATFLQSFEVDANSLRGRI